LETDAGQCGGHLAQAKENAGVLLGNYTPYNQPEILLKSATAKDPEFLRVFQDVRMNSWLADMAEALIAQNIAYDIGDLESWTVDEMLGYRVMFLPAYRLMGHEVQLKLVEYVKRGGTLFLSPKLPEYDINLEACSILRAELFPGVDPTEGMCYHNITWDDFGYLGVSISDFQHVDQVDKLQTGPTSPIATLRDGSAIGLESKVGQGRAYWLGSDLATKPQLAEFMQWFCSMHDIEATADLLPEKAGASGKDIHVSVACHADHNFVVLTNRSTDDFAGIATIHLSNDTVQARVEIPSRRGMVLWYQAGKLHKSFVSDFRGTPHVDVIEG
jgi:hypothetical protein